MGNYFDERFRRYQERVNELDELGKQLAAENDRVYGFDYDGSLVRVFTADPLPGRREVLSLLRAGRARMFLATNQAGPVYRAVLGNPKYPTVEQIAANIAVITDLRGLDWQPDLVLVCTHAGAKERDVDEWHRAAMQVANQLRDLLLPIFEHRLAVSPDEHWRKPNAGMLQYAIWQFATSADQVTYIGDMPTDAEAASRAGIGYQDAESFFASS